MEEETPITGGTPLHRVADLRDEVAKKQKTKKKEAQKKPKKPHRQIEKENPIRGR